MKDRLIGTRCARAGSPPESRVRASFRGEIGAAPRTDASCGGTRAHASSRRVQRLRQRTIRVMLIRVTWNTETRC